MASRQLRAIDRSVVDSAVDGVGTLAQIAAWLSHMSDKYLVDGLVTATGRGAGQTEFSRADDADGTGPELRAAHALGPFCFSDSVPAGWLVTSVHTITRCGADTRSLQPVAAAGNADDAPGSHVLSLILFTPLAGALLLLVIPRRHEAAIRWIANLFGVTGLVASLPLWFRYQPQGAAWQFVERAEWIPSIGASLFLGVDGLSALLVLLTTLIGAIAILSSWSSIADRIKESYVCLLVLQTAMIGAFVSLDALLFFFFWE